LIGKKSRKEKGIEEGGWGCIGAEIETTESNDHNREEGPKRWGKTEAERKEEKGNQQTDGEEIGGVEYHFTYPIRSCSRQKRDSIGQKEEQTSHDASANQNWIQHRYHYIQKTQERVQEARPLPPSQLECGYFRNFKRPSTVEKI